MNLKNNLKAIWILPLALWMPLDASLLPYGRTSTMSNASPENVDSVLFKDSLVWFKIQKSSDSLCENWDQPQAQEILTLIKQMEPITGNEWHDCYGDWSCGIEGELTLAGVNYFFRLDAAGWVILHNSGEQLFYGCRSKCCWKHFAAEAVCDSLGVPYD